MPLGPTTSLSGNAKARWGLGFPEAGASAGLGLGSGLGSGLGLGLGLAYIALFHNSMGYLTIMMLYDFTIFYVILEWNWLAS